MFEPEDPRPDSPPIHVVAGVIADARGRVLLARRTQGRDLAGLWEFPGGKVEPGERPEQALMRELQEELGIQSVPGEPLIAVPQRYPHKRLLLDVRRMARWTGTPKGLDGQAMAWVPLDKLRGYAMPPADRPVVAALRDASCYAITPTPGDDDDAWLQGLQQALQSGIERVQLRAPGVHAARWQLLARRAVALCKHYARPAQVLVNGDCALAQTLGIGVHLPAAQLLRLQARPLPTHIPVAASCHNLQELRHAEKIGCDFAVLGPVLPTATHPEAVGIGWTGFAALREEVSLPIYAIGGLSAQNLPQARRVGAQGIAAIRGLWGV